jgi:hypothetical protein
MRIRLKQLVGVVLEQVRLSAQLMEEAAAEALTQKYPIYR